MARCVRNTDFHGRVPEVEHVDHMYKIGSKRKFTDDIDVQSSAIRNLQKQATARSPIGIPNLDGKEFKTLTYDPTYAQSIYFWKRSHEILYVSHFENLPRGEIQPEITEHMRTILLDWLVTILEDHHLSSNTYTLAVHLIDYALTLLPIKRNQFQLLGCACIWLAAKLEEVRPPMLENLLFVSDYCFDAETLILMEQRIMKQLEYRPLIPTRHFFCSRFGRAAAFSDKEQALANYLTEVSLFDASLSQFVASKVAAAAVHLTLQMLRPRVDGDVQESLLWTSTMEYYTEYKEIELVDVILQLRTLHFYFEDGDHHKNMIKRWEKPVHHRAAQIYALRLEDVCFSTPEARLKAAAWNEREKRRSLEKNDLTRHQAEEKERERAKVSDRTRPDVDCSARAMLQQRMKEIGSGAGMGCSDSKRVSAPVNSVQATLVPSKSLQSGLNKLGHLDRIAASSSSNNIPSLASKSNAYTATMAGLQSLNPLNSHATAAAAAKANACSAEGGIAAATQQQKSRQLTYQKRSGTVP